VFLQDGRADHVTASQPYGTFYAGSWPINNQVMAEALEFAGYDVKLVLGSEGHNMKQGAAIMPEALRWLWRDYPKPIVAREPAAMREPDFEPRGRVSTLVSLDKPWEQVGETYKSVSSPAGDKDGNVYFADPAANRIYKFGRDGKVILFKDNSSGATALRVGADGRLYASQPGRKRIVSYGPGGDEKVVAQNVEANDLAPTAKGEIYFLDTPNKRVGYVDSKGRKRIVYDGGEILLPTAVSLSPDQAMLIVADGQTRFSWSFQIAADGSLVNGEPFFRLEMPEISWLSGARGVTVDADGLVYITSAVGIQVFEQNGRCTRILSKPQFGDLAGLAFAGAGLNWLYVAEGGKLYRRPAKVKGVTAWEPVKPPKPLL
jgi:sugar lactone lactonase YvrE